jgi:hypothetical protein
LYFCLTEKESISHVLWGYPSASDVWSICGRKIQKSRFRGQFFVDIFEYLVNICTAEELALYAEVARRLWFRRNGVMHGENFLRPREFLQSANLFIEEYNQTLVGEVNRMLSVSNVELNELGDLNVGASFNVGHFSDETRLSRWIPSSTRYLKVNWDAALNTHDGKMGYGLIVRDFSGKVFAAACFTTFSVLDPVVAEAYAALRAVEFCRTWRLIIA